MNTCEELIKQVSNMIGHSPVITNQNRVKMVPDDRGDWVRKDTVIGIIVKEAKPNGR